MLLSKKALKLTRMTRTLRKEKKSITSSFKPLKNQDSTSLFSPRTTLLASSWCLDELVKIMECQKKQSGQSVYPIFYDVEPTQVRKQSGDFGKAFSKHENDEDAQKWREALVEATSFSGRDLSTTADGHEVEFIKLVVKDISSKLPVVSADGNLIGMRTRINDVVSSLNAFPDEFCMLGIWGMGGSGKTTLARAVFDQICNEFEGISFVENVREVSNSPLLGLKSLQQQVLRDVLNRQDITVNGVFDGKKMLKKNMPGRKALVVLDDVDHIEQLKALADEPNWFKSGSKIIVTTRDKQVLLAHKVNLIHDVNLLKDEEAICLLSRRAFGTEIPSRGYEELSKKVVSYAAGLPLTITILGSFLCDANEAVWIDTLERLEKIPLEETLQKLELSYMGLNDDCKEMFLDVACLLKGWKEDKTIRALESCGFHAIHGLNVLEKRSLITISGRDRRLYMHDHIEEMGRYIVRRSNLDDPRRHSRLWIEEEINDILVNDLGAEATCIDMIGIQLNHKTIMKGLKKMEKLRFLVVFNLVLVDSELDEDSQYLPNSLRYLKWRHYPFRSLPKTFQGSNLVALKMPCSMMKQLWEGGERKVLHKLRFLDLKYSSLWTFDLGLTPNLEILNLEHSCDLVKFDMSLRCPKLNSLNLNGSKLSTLDLRLVPNIETLNLMGCSDLVELDIPCKCPQLKFLKVSSPKLRSLDLRFVPNIATLNLDGCCDLVELDIPCECPQLTSINLSSSKLRSLDLRLVPNIEILSLYGCLDLVELHMPDRCLKLGSIDIRKCSELKTLDLGRTPNLKSLHLEDCYSLGKLHAFIGGLTKLIKLEAKGFLRFRNFNFVKRYGLLLPELHLHGKLVDICPLHPDNNFPKFQFECSYEEDLPSSIGNLEKLISVGFSCACTDLESFFKSICGLQHLGNLTLKGSIPEVPKDLGRLQCLETLTVWSRSIKHLPDSICMLKRLKSLDLFCCELLEKLPEELGRLECLEKLILMSKKIKHLPDSICMLKRLKSLDLYGSVLLEKLPEDLGRLECLEELFLMSKMIKHLPDSICMLKRLKSLDLYGCALLEKLPEDLGRLEFLEKLFLMSKKIIRLPDSICMLKRLKFLDLYGCALLEKLPEDLGRLECLEQLTVGATNIKHLPDSICMLKRLKSLNLYGCELLEKLPEDLGRLECLEDLNLERCNRVKELPDELGRLECLKMLDIQGTCINNLPQSILMLEGLQILQSEGEAPTTTSTEGFLRPEDETSTPTSTICCCTVL